MLCFFFRGVLGIVGVLVYIFGVDLKGERNRQYMSVVVATSLLFQNKEINFGLIYLLFSF